MQHGSDRHYVCYLTGSLPVTSELTDKIRGTDSCSGLFHLVNSFCSIITGGKRQRMSEDRSGTAATAGGDDVLLYLCNTSKHACSSSEPGETRIHKRQLPRDGLGVAQEQVQ